MKHSKFIVFADTKTHCEKPGDNFLGQDLKLEYGSGANETAIGLKSNEYKNITSFDDSYDIYLFNDTFSKPQSGSIFFKVFAGEFFKTKEKFDYKIILHRSSKWNFNSFETQAGKFFAKFATEIEWFQSLQENKQWIYQSHKQSEVYGKELKAIAKAILKKDSNKYTQAIESLNQRFTDKRLEELLKVFEKLSPVLSNDEKTDSKISKAKSELKKYLQLS